MTESFKPVYVSPETISEIEDRARAANVYFMDVPTLLAAYRWMEHRIDGLRREIFFLKRWQANVVNFYPDIEDIKTPLFTEEEYQKWLQSQLLEGKNV